MKSIISRVKIAQLLHLIVFFVTFCAINLFPMRMPEVGKALAKRWTGLQYKEEAKSKKRELLIFLDDSEQGKNIGFTGSSLVAAIAQRVGPIIVSTSLLNNIINEETRYYFIQDFFQSNQWIIKKINDSLNLLIPTNYLKDFNIDIEKVKAFDSAMGIDVVSDVELQLGLKVNHMETIEYHSMNWPTYLKTQFLSYVYISPEEEASGLEFADYFINSLDDIFCKRLDYQNKKINVPEWLMYIAGHGGLLHSIAHISLDDFKKLLHFLDSKINTKLLVVFSCYAAGMNINKIYGEIKLGTQAYYSFPIIIQALNDTVVKTVAPEMDIKGFWNKKLNLIIYVDFVSFFKKAKEVEGNYSEIIKPVALNVLENLPQIKLPGMEWFSVIDIDKKIVSIGSTLVRTRDPQKSLDVASFFKKYPEIILLYTDIIPFELVINSLKMKYMISMVSPQLIEENTVKEVYTRIKKISSIQSFSDILYWFSPITASSYSLKYFFIDEIADKKDIIILRTNDGSMRVYYKNKEDVEFTVKLKKEELEKLKEIQFEKVDKDSEFSTYYQGFIRERDEYSQRSEEREKERQGITSEQIKEIENTLINQLKKQKEESTVSEPEVD